MGHQLHPGEVASGLCDSPPVFILRCRCVGRPYFDTRPEVQRNAETLDRIYRLSRDRRRVTFSPSVAVEACEQRPKLLLELDFASPVVVARFDRSCRN